MPFQIIRQDVTKINCDCIVNPTNPMMSPGGGVDKAIHNAAGPLLRNACHMKKEALKVSEVFITEGFNLPCKTVIHTTGPEWHGGGFDEEAALRQCYKNVLNAAAENDVKTIAIPLISSGTNGFPKDKAMSVALDEIMQFLFNHEMMIYVVTYSKEAADAGAKVIGNVEDMTDGNAPEETPRRREPEHQVETLDEYGKNCKDEGFFKTLCRFIELKGMKDSQCYKGANVSKGSFYTYKNNVSNPTKNTVLGFAISLKLTLKETRELLASAGYSLNDSFPTDKIVKYHIVRKKYDLKDIQTELYEHGLSGLGQK